MSEARNELWLAMNITDPMTIAMLKNSQTNAKQIIPGDYVDDTSFHITIDYIGKETDDNVKKVQQAMQIFQDNYAKDFPAFYVFASTLNRFDRGAAWLDVSGAFKLFQIRYIFDDIYKQVNYQHPERDFKSYVPHITMAFNTPEFAPIKMSKIPVLVDNVTLWNSPKVNDSYVNSFLNIIKL